MNPHLIVLAALLARLVILSPEHPVLEQPKETHPQPVPAAKPDNPSVVPAPRKEDSSKERHEQFNARAKQGHEKGDIDLIFLGDSITEGWESAGKEVWQKYYAKRNAVDFGIGGDETQHVLWRLENGNVDGLDKPQPKDAKPPHLVVLMIGTNNLGNSSATPEQTAAGVEAVVKELRTKLPQTRVLLLAIFPRDAKPDGALRNKVAATNQLIKAAKLPDGVTYLDIADKFTDRDGVISKEVMPDQLHLSPKGYEIWAQAIEPKVHELLGEK
jgi:lysophospholipase L1-like esterase